jgi:hypothetical protein
MPSPTVVFGLKNVNVLSPARVNALHCLGLLMVVRNRKNKRAPLLEDTKNLTIPFLIMPNVFKHIGCDYHIELITVVVEILEIRTVPWIFASGNFSGIIFGVVIIEFVLQHGRI